MKLLKTILPEYIVFYKEGILKSFSEENEFILSSAKECLETNLKIKCVELDYFFMEYLGRQFKQKNIKVRYSQAVTSFGKSNESINFKKLKLTKTVCIYHKGSYENLKDAYVFIMKYTTKNNLQIAACPPPLSPPPQPVKTSEHGKIKNIASKTKNFFLIISHSLF